jgi:hypothetical protein
MMFIGDAHGEFKTYEYILFKMQHKGGKKGVDCSCQLGDMGIGFPEVGAYTKDGFSWSPEINTDHKFIRGNHDSPEECKNHPNYLGDYGYVPVPSIFYVSGGFSIDHRSRYNGLNFWEDEELSHNTMLEVIELYKKSKPRIVVSHECPLDMKNYFVRNQAKLGYDSRTEELLQTLFEIHQPEYWIFGHHHHFREMDQDGTHFVCLDELIDGRIKNCIYEIKGLSWE